MICPFSVKVKLLFLRNKISAAVKNKMTEQFEKSKYLNRNEMTFVIAQN